MSNLSISLIIRVETPDDRYFESIPLDGILLKVGEKVLPLESIVLKLLSIVSREVLDE